MRHYLYKQYNTGISYWTFAVYKESRTHTDLCLGCVPPATSNTAADKDAMRNNHFKKYHPVLSRIFTFRKNEKLAAKPHEAVDGIGQACLSVLDEDMDILLLASSRAVATSSTIYNNNNN